MSKFSLSFPIQTPVNDPVLNYAPGDAARVSLQKQLADQVANPIDIPCIINGKEIRTGQTRKVVMPHSHREVLATVHMAGEKEIQQAASSALAAKPAWESLPWEKRAEIFYKAGELLAGSTDSRDSWRNKLNAATMLGQSKNAYQAEVDSACELIDFLKFNAYFYQELKKTQPLSVNGIKNRMEYRSLEGFILAITPFNFTAIAGNLPSAPAMLGNTVVWKPSDTQLLAAYHTMKLFEEAGLPPGVINFVPADGPLFGNTLVPHKDLAGIHFTGSTATFRGLWKQVGDNISNYKSYPRLVGETGGKGFVFAHPTANWEFLATALTRGAFEFQGQKCSAASRAYIPKSLWGRVQEKLLADLESISMGDVREFKNFVNAVIDERAFKKITSYIDYVKSSPDAKIIAGGKSDMSTGYFIEPTVVLTEKHDFKTMKEEIFGPVLTVLVYDDAKVDEHLKICDQTSPYALTGAIFAEDPAAIQKMLDVLRYSAGNFYINDKPTGAVVGQQPFGGGRASGTNDKAGSYLNLVRWLSPRTVKEVLQPPKDYRYPFLG